MSTMKKIILSTIPLVLIVTVSVAITSIYPSIAGEAAALQVDGTAEGYAISKTAIQLQGVLRLVRGIFWGALIWIWVVPLVRKSKSNGGLALLLTMLIFGTAACRPYAATILVEIEPNQTAFVVPLTGDTSDQGQFLSLEYLQANQVATRRIEIGVVWHQTGRMPSSGDYVPVARVILVDRSPVTREWTQKEERGTSEIDDAFEMETRESIDFSYGGVLSALITEEDAALFLYRYSGKELAQIIDTDIRAFMQGELASSFGSLDIGEAQLQKGALFSEVCEAAIEKFDEFGITITACGASGGLIYHDPKIQQAITANFEAEQAKIRARAALEAQEIENLRILAEAEALAESTRIAGLAEADVLKLLALALREEPLLINYMLAIRSTGEVPDTLFFSGASGQLPFPFFLIDPENLPK